MWAHGPTPLTVLVAIYSLVITGFTEVQAGLLTVQYMKTAKTYKSRKGKAKKPFKIYKYLLNEKKDSSAS